MTVLELLVGITVAGMVLAAGLPAFRAMLDGYSYQNSVTAVTSFSGASQALAATTLRAVIGDIPLDDVLAKREEILSQYQSQLGVPRLDAAIDWGNFWFLTRPIFVVLEFFYNLVGNFGQCLNGPDAVTQEKNSQPPFLLAQDGEQHHLLDRERREPPFDLALQGLDIEYLRRGRGE